MKFDPRYLELAGAVLAGIATDEEKLEFKSLKSIVKKELRANFAVAPEMLIAKLEKRIAVLQLSIDVIRDTGKAPPKSTGIGKRGRPKKEVATE